MGTLARPEKNTASKPTLGRRKILVLPILTMGGLTLLAVCYYGLKPRAAETLAITSANTSIDEPTKIRPGIPKRLKISKLNIDAVIEPMGLTPQGDLDAPTTLADTGWYKDGVRPGEAGSAVIDGHFSAVGGKIAVFDDLHKLQKGDELIIQDENGTSIKFMMSGSREYAPGENAKAVFYSDDGKSRLNLITCQGSWVQTQQSYATRLVVFFDRAPEL